jgi:hypothetical protein
MSGPRQPEVGPLTETFIESALFPASQQVAFREELPINRTLTGKVDCHVDPDAMQIFAHQRSNVGPIQATQATTECRMMSDNYSSPVTTIKIPHPALR